MNALVFIYDAIVLLISIVANKGNDFTVTDLQAIEPVVNAERTDKYKPSVSNLIICRRLSAIIRQLQCMT